jgi:hypothetical protein
MPIEFKKQKAVFRGGATVEEAEALLEWLQTKPAAKVDLSTCSHLHTADLQVLMAAKTEVASWPADSDLRAWLETALKSA